MECLLIADLYST